MRFRLRSEDAKHPKMNICKESFPFCITASLGDLGLFAFSMLMLANLAPSHD